MIFRVSVGKTCPHMKSVDRHTLRQQHTREIAQATVYSEIQAPAEVPNREAFNHLFRHRKPPLAVPLREFCHDAA
jgi:hypothetical protein